MTGEIVKFLKENIKESPRKILDVCCGYGELVSKLSSAYPNSQVYGLDINRESLACGIAEGNFKKAFPVHGDAYNLGRENPKFSLVHLDPKYYRGEHVDWEKLEHRELKEYLTDFDLVTAVNPSNRLSSYEVNLLIAGKQLDKHPIPLEVISIPAKKGGHVLYSMALASKSAGFYGGPFEVTKGLIEERLTERRKEGKDIGLGFIDYSLMENREDDETNLAVLFKKL